MARCCQVVWAPMLDRLFSQLCELEGVRHVRLTDQFGKEILSTKKWPESVEEQRQEWANYCSLGEQLGIHPLFETWSEGRRLTLSDHFDNNLFIHLSGKDGKKGAWRYGLERLRQEWNAKQPEVI